MSNASTQVNNLIKRHPVVVYYGLAIVFTWAIQLPLIAVVQGWADAPIPLWLHYLASLGPTAAALIVTAWTTGQDGLKELWRRITRWRIGWRWGLFAILSLRQARLCLAAPAKEHERFKSDTRAWSVLDGVEHSGILLSRDLSGHGLDHSARFYLWRPVRGRALDLAVQRHRRQRADGGPLARHL